MKTDLKNILATGTLIALPFFIGLFIYASANDTAPAGNAQETLAAQAALDAENAKLREQRIAEINAQQEALIARQGTSEPVNVSTSTARKASAVKQAITEPTNTTAADAAAEAVAAQKAQQEYLAAQEAARTRELALQAQAEAQAQAQSFSRIRISRAS